jgi:hypothetical protein
LPLWSGNDAAHDAFGYAIDLADLPLSDHSVARVRKLSDWHDTALNQEYPPDPGPWDADECDRFNAAARQLLTDLKSELGSEFDIVDEFKPESPGS